MITINQIRSSEYLLINIIFALLFLSIFIYSLIFASSGAYPVKSVCDDIDTPICISKGLSRAFSQIMLGNIEEAKSLNKHSLLIFLFFLIQIISRVTLSVFYTISIKKRMVINLDIAFSSLLFIYCFKGFLIKLVETFFSFPNTYTY